MKPLVRTNFTKRASCLSAAAACTSLPTTVLEYSSPTVFESRLKTHPDIRPAVLPLSLKLRPYGEIETRTPLTLKLKFESILMILILILTMRLITVTVNKREVQNVRENAIFSEFAIARPSVVCLSVVCNVRAPYSGGSNFRRYFYGIRYLGHPLTSTENSTEIVPREPLRRGS